MAGAKSGSRVPVKAAAAAAAVLAAEPSARREGGASRLLRCHRLIQLRNHVFPDGDILLQLPYLLAIQYPQDGS